MARRCLFQLKLEYSLLKSYRDLSAYVHKAVSFFFLKKITSIFFFFA